MNKTMLRTLMILAVALWALVGVAKDASPPIAVPAGALLRQPATVAAVPSPGASVGGIWLMRQGKRAILAGVVPFGEVTNLVVKGFSPTFSAVGGADSGLADLGFALHKDIRIADRAWVVVGLAGTIEQGDRWRPGLLLGISAKF